MRVEITEAVWLDERQEFSLEELAELSGLSEPELRQLIDYDALSPAGLHAGAAAFDADCLATARAACRLRNDFDLDAGGLALALTLLRRIHDLEAQVRSLQAQLPGRIR
jgi:chaperone modulatory protein CbpM